MQKLILIVTAGTCFGLAACKGQTVSESTKAPDTTATTIISLPSSVASQKSVGVECRLKIDGMVCQGCADTTASKLRETEGVYDAQVSFEDRIASVRYDPAKVTPEAFARVIGELEMGGRHFTATILTAAEGAAITSTTPGEQQ